MDININSGVTVILVRPHEQHARAIVDKIKFRHLERRIDLRKRSAMGLACRYVPGGLGSSSGGSSPARGRQRFGHHALKKPLRDLTRLVKQVDTSIDGALGRHALQMNQVALQNGTKATPNDHVLPADAFELHRWR
jgi:hypothetical protein